MAWEGTLVIYQAPKRPYRLAFLLCFEMRTRRAARTSLLFSPHLFVPCRHLAAYFSCLPAAIPHNAPALRPTFQLFRRPHTLDATVLDAQTKAKLALSTDISLTETKPLYHRHQIQTERKGTYSTNTFLLFSLSFGGGIIDSKWAQMTFCFSFYYSTSI